MSEYIYSINFMEFEDYKFLSRVSELNRSETEPDPERVELLDLATRYLRVKKDDRNGWYLQDEKSGKKYFQDSIDKTIEAWKEKDSKDEFWNSIDPWLRGGVGQLLLEDIQTANAGWFKPTFYKGIDWKTAKKAEADRYQQMKKDAENLGFLLKKGDHGLYLIDSKGQVIGQKTIKKILDAIEERE